jgi:hypothetical protein
MADQPADETPEKAGRGKSAGHFGLGFLFAAMASLLTFGTAIALMAPMSWAAVFVFFPLMGIALIAWTGIVALANRGNSDMWGGTIAFAVAAVVSVFGWFAYQDMSKEQVRAQQAKAHMQLGTKLSTAQIVEAPVGQMDRLAYHSNGCYFICSYALIHGLAKEFAAIDERSNSVKFFRVQPSDLCQSYEPSSYHTYKALQELGILDKCIRMEHYSTDVALYTIVSRSILISYQSQRQMKEAGLFPSVDVEGIVARRIGNDGQIGEEIARWEHLRGRHKQISFGSSIEPRKFLHALTGIPASSNNAFVERTFAEAIDQIADKLDSNKLRYDGILRYLSRLVRETREKTKKPVLVTPSTASKLQMINDKLCKTDTGINDHCSRGFASLQKKLTVNGKL